MGYGKDINVNFLNKLKKAKIPVFELDPKQPFVKLEDLEAAYMRDEVRFIEHPMVTLAEVLELGVKGTKEDWEKLKLRVINYGVTSK